MIKARIGIKEYQSFMRLAGIRDIYEIEASNLEINGQISHIKKRTTQLTHNQGHIW
jgi:uncharacterized membrane protein YcaP (DUF421 family)